MIKRRFTIAFRGVKGLAMVTFDDIDRLEGIDISELYDFKDDDKRAWILHWIPRKLDTLEALIGVAEDRGIKSKITIKAVIEDLSFQKFWDTYGYKQGKKPRCEKLWNAMSTIERTKCLEAIPKYKYYLSTKSNMEMIYPEGFLSQRRYENEFKV